MAARVLGLRRTRQPNEPMPAAALGPTHLGVEAAAGMIAAGIILVGVAGPAGATLHNRRWKADQRKREAAERQPSNESPHRFQIVDGDDGRVNISMASAVTDA